MTSSPLGKSVVDTVLRATLVVVMLGVVGFCLFGYQASYELPGPEGRPFRIISAVAGSGAIATVGWAALGKRRWKP